MTTPKDIREIIEKINEVENNRSDIIIAETNVENWLNKMFLEKSSLDSDRVKQITWNNYIISDNYKSVIDVLQNRRGLKLHKALRIVKTVFRKKQHEFFERIGLPIS